MTSTIVAFRLNDAVSRIISEPFADTLQAPTGALIPLTLAEIRRLLWSLLWQSLPDIDCVIGWSRWRRQRQATALVCYYTKK